MKKPTAKSSRTAAAQAHSLEQVVRRLRELGHEQLAGQVDGVLSGLSTARSAEAQDDCLSDSAQLFPHMRDTELREMTERNLELEAHLKQAQRLETVGSMAGGLAHDFNNILLAISGYTELALREPAANEAVKLKLQRVLQGCQRAKNLVDKLLLFSRREKPAFQCLEFESLVRESLDLVRAGMPSTIRLEPRLKAGGMHINGDEGQLQQVLFNLCTNAVHALEDGGGTVTVSVDERTLQSNRRGCPPGLGSGTYLVLGVEDTGCGIPPEHIERLFDPYFTTKEKGQGTGLGLPIVHGIVKEHKGAITVDSRPGVGTLMEVFLPVVSHESRLEAESALEAPVPALAQPVHQKNRKNVMLVDDEFDLIELQAEFLRDWGYRVVVFNDPLEALQAFAANPDAFDILVTDQTMPDLTGLQLVDEMRKSRPQLPVILLSGFSRDITPESLARHRVAKFFQKPFGLSDLAREISLQCGGI